MNSSGPAMLKSVHNKSTPDSFRGVLCVYITAQGSYTLMLTDDFCVSA